MLPYLIANWLEKHPQAAILGLTGLVVLFGVFVA